MISGLILAAGQSRRMGEPKALLDWGGTSLGVYQVEQLHEAGCDEVVVVLGARADEVHRELRRADCRVMFNALHAAGRAGSLRIGARAVNRNAKKIVIINIDQPRPASFTQGVIEALNGDARIAIPTHAGRHGHPIVVAGSLREELMRASEEEEGLRGIVRRHADGIVEVPSDDLCGLDMNTPDDYAAARERFGLGAAIS